MFRMILTIMLVLSFAAPAWAQSSEPLVVLTETVVETAGEPARSYWWSSGASAEWTPSDRAIDAAMSERGLSMRRPSDLSRMSKIYRRPNLSEANAVALATLFGAPRVITGEIRIERLRDAHPLGMVGYRGTLEASMLESGREGPVTLHRFEITRSRFEMSAEDAASAVRREIATAFARILSAKLRRRIGPVGVASEELLVGLADLATGQALREIKTFLRGLDGVGDVRERWVSEGVVVLELNPASPDSDDSVKRLARVLAAQSFENFRVETLPQSRWPGDVLEMRVLSVNR